MINRAATTMSILVRDTTGTRQTIDSGYILDVYYMYIYLYGYILICMCTGKKPVVREMGRSSKKMMMSLPDDGLLSLLLGLRTICRACCCCCCEIALLVAKETLRLPFSSLWWWLSGNMAVTLFGGDELTEDECRLWRWLPPPSGSWLVAQPMILFAAPSSSSSSFSFTLRHDKHHRTETHLTLFCRTHEFTPQVQQQVHAQNTWRLDASTCHSRHARSSLFAPLSSSSFSLF